MSFFLRVNSNFCSTIKKLWVGSPKPWYPQRPCCQVAMFPPIGVKGRLRQLALGSNAWERRRSSRLRCFFRWLCGDFPFNIGSDQGLQMAVWSCLLRILFLLVFSRDSHLYGGCNPPFIVGCLDRCFSWFKVDPRRDRFLLVETNTRTAGFKVDIYQKLNHTPKYIQFLPL